MDRPFQCEIVAKRIGVSLVSVKPDYEYIGYENGESIWRDQRLEARINEAMAQGATELASRVPWIQPFLVTPQGGARFKLTMQHQLVPLSRDYSSVVELR